MTETSRLIIGLVMLLLVEVALGGTLIFVMRRRRGFVPAWSWWWAVGVYLLFAVIIGVVSVLPVFDRVAFVMTSFVGFVGFKYLADLSFVYALLASVGMRLVMLLATAALGIALSVDLFVVWS